MSEEASENESRSQRTVVFEKICSVWAQSDHWPLEDGLRLMLELPPRAVAGTPLSAADERRLDILRALAHNCIGITLHLVDVPDFDDDLHVMPNELIDWADLKEQPVSATLRNAVNRAWVEQHGQERMQALNPDQRRRERCRALAALFWSENPELDVNEMIKLAEFRQFGCEGRRYRRKTMRDWIIDLAPAQSTRQRGLRPTRA